MLSRGTCESFQWNIKYNIHIIFAYQYIFIAWGYLILTFNSWNGRPLSFPPWRRNPQGWLVDCLQEEFWGNYFPSISPRQAEVDKSGDAISNSERLLSSVDNIMHRDFHWSSEAFKSLQVQYEQIPQMHGHCTSSKPWQFKNTWKTLPATDRPSKK